MPATANALPIISITPALPRRFTPCTGSGQGLTSSVSRGPSARNRTTCPTSDRPPRLSVGHFTGREPIEALAAADVALLAQKAANAILQDHEESSRFAEHLQVCSRDKRGMSRPMDSRTAEVNARAEAARIHGKLGRWRYPERTIGWLDASGLTAQLNLPL